MSDAFWVFMGILVVQVAAIALAIINNRKAASDREAIKAEVRHVKAQVAENTEITQAIKLTKDDMDAQGAGRERLGFIEGRRSATGSMPLGG